MAESDKHYKFLYNLIHDFCKEQDEINEFFEHLNGYLEAELELEKECEQ
jgi:hypothetical protein